MYLVNVSRCRCARNAGRIHSEFTCEIPSSFFSLQNPSATALSRPLRNAPVSRDSRARLSNNFDLKSRRGISVVARRAFRCVHGEAHATRFEIRSRSNAKFISRFRSGSRRESWKVTRGIFDTGWASPIDLTNSFSVFHESLLVIITPAIIVGLLLFAKRQSLLL